MRYELTPIASGTLRTRRAFAWLPRRIGWLWLWLESYTVHERYVDPDGDGIYEWLTVEEVAHARD